jgi:PadR family transcriptional regulator PadR
MKLRRSPQTALVMAEFLQDKEEWKYGYDLSRNTGLRSGTLYPILMRLALHGLLETSWEATLEGRPPRHLYKITQDGLRYARTLVREKHGVIVGDPAFTGAGGG